MKTFFLFLLFMVIAFMVILLAIILGELGAWYFSWVVGTIMIVLVTATGGALLDTEEELAAQDANTP
ncbi:MAG: hypothetical protein ABI351_09385 [Herbaspirillum sp.]